MAESVTPPAPSEESSESFTGATARARATGHRFTHFVFPGVALLSVVFAAIAFVVNVTVLAIFGERDGFVAVEFLGVSWGQLALAVLAHALLIYVVFLFARMAFRDSFIAAMVVAMGFPGVTAAYMDPWGILGASLMLAACIAGVLNKQLISALFGVAATFATPFAWGLWILYAVFLLQRKGKSWAWLGLITLFTPAVSQSDTHRLISEGLLSDVSPLALFLILTTIVWLCSREELWPPAFFVLALVLWRMWGSFSVALFVILAWLPLAVESKRKLRKLPFLLVCVVWVFFGAWVSAHGLVQGLPA